MIVRKFSSIEVERAGTPSAEEIWIALQRIREAWPDAWIHVPGPDPPVMLREIVTIPDANAILVYRDHESLIDWNTNGEPDPSSWIRITADPKSLILTMNAWGSASGRLVRGILGIDRDPQR